MFPHEGTGCRVGTTGSLAIYRGFILILVGYYFGNRQSHIGLSDTDRQTDTEESCGHLSQIAGDSSQCCAHCSW